MGGDTNNNMSSTWTGGPPAAPPPNSIIDINKYLGPPGAPAQASDNKGGVATGQTFPQQQPQQLPPQEVAGGNKGGIG